MAIKKGDRLKCILPGDPGNSLSWGRMYVAEADESLQQCIVVLGDDGITKLVKSYRFEVISSTESDVQVPSEQAPTKERKYPPGFTWQGYLYGDYNG